MSDDTTCLCVWNAQDAANPEKGPTEINERCPIHGKGGNQ